jgi:sugar-specific transcriptional regulator TrmB
MNNELMIIEDMKKLGLSEYETKAYLSLLKEFPVNGYTLSKNSGIPRSRIYDILESLKSKQVIFEEKGVNTTLYYPLEPELLISKIKKDYNETIERVDKFARDLYYKKRQSNEVIVIKGRQEVLDFTGLLLSKARHRVALSIWEEELHALKDCIDEVLDRGVMLAGIFFGSTNPYSQLASHRRTERVLSEKKERYIIVIIDGDQVMSGIISRGEESQVTWTRDKGFVEMSEDYIIHDISLNRLLHELNDDERQKYESFLDNLRKEYFGLSEVEFNSFK